ncbi:MAG TPA: putative quinol monooxygenase [Casimicrobiaceae bacterium]
MSQFVVWVELTVRPAAMTRFAELVRANAAASLRDEPGCRRFDVLRPTTDDVGAIALYEIYDSEAAFAAHMQTVHYRAFAEATADMTQHKVVRTFHLA